MVYEFTGERMRRTHENERWTVGIKNRRSANGVTDLDTLERYNGTDELFVLLSGSCALIPVEELENGWALDKVEMRPGQVYNIPRTLWHNTITQKDTKVILVGDSNTEEGDSDFHRLTAEDLRAVRQLV